MKRKKIGFIGAGNMGEALIRGLLGAGMVTAGDILISEQDPERAASLRKNCRVRSAESGAALAGKADVLFLAVKPRQLEVVLEEIAPVVDRSKLLVSVAAGITLSHIESRLTSPPRLVRAMPNTPALVGEGATAVSCGRLVTAADRRFLMKVFGAVGRVVEVEEDLMDAVTGLSGSGPAYVFTMIEALADGGVQAGLPRGTALELAAQTVLGAARMVLETGSHPSLLRDRVASPGGTTIQGIAALEALGFRSAVMAAVEAAADRSRELSEK